MTGVAQAPWLPAAAVALSAALWGLWWLPLRALAEAGLSGAAVNAALYGITTVALLPWFWRRRRRLARGGLLLLGAGGLFGAALVSWNLALILGEVVRVTLLFYLAPVWATLLALALLRVPVGGLRIVSVVLGLAGAVVLLGFAGGLPLPRSAGDWLGFAAGVLFALSVTLVRKGAAIEGFEQTLTAFASDDLVAGAFRAGARGYIGKEASEVELVRAVRAASRGEMVVSGDAVERLHSHLNGVDDAHGLTDRERQVLALLERGSTDREIAAALTISVKTVEKHVGSILRKLGAQNRTQAVARARERLAG